MNDYDASYVWDYETSYHDDNLDESYAHNTWELDDEYRRDSHDYTILDYIHFAYYHISFEICVYHMTHYILSQDP